MSQAQCILDRTGYRRQSICLYALIDSCKSFSDTSTSGHWAPEVASIEQPEGVVFANIAVVL